MLSSRPNGVKHIVDNVQRVAIIEPAPRSPRAALALERLVTSLPETASLPATDCLIAAVTTPLTADLHPDHARLAARTAALMAAGCDGVALFGTTGEGAEFSVADRMAGLEAVLASGIAPGRVIVSIGALAIPDVVALGRHAAGLGVAGTLLMPPCVYRRGITEDGTFRYYATVIEQAGPVGLGLHLYHFPDISGVPLTPATIRRLDERFPGVVTGIKDSGGDADHTDMLSRRFSHLSIYTGNEIDVPQVMVAGARGTICGLANVMPRLMRAMLDQGTAFDRRQLVPLILAGDAALCRRPFIASVKAVLADATGERGWRRVLPPMAELPLIEEARLIADFRRWEAGLPAEWRSLYPAPAAETASERVVALRRG